MKDERFREDGAKAILFDAALSPQVDGNWFVPSYWRARGALRSHPGGRGGISLIATPAGECVLKHYRRGGAVARVLGDRYLWRGFERSRPFAELRLLGELSRRGLPAPQPVAACCRRQGLFYTADLITMRIEGSHTLAEHLEDGQLDAALAGRAGALIARFHHQGVWHADLNAHNVLIANAGLFLVDFDRGELRVPHEGWRRENLERLRRSLLKLGAGAGGMAAFERTIWAPLQQGYEAAYAEADRG